MANKTVDLTVEQAREYARYFGYPQRTAAAKAFAVRLDELAVRLVASNKAHGRISIDATERTFLLFMGLL